MRYAINLHTHVDVRSEDNVQSIEVLNLEVCIRPFSERTLDMNKWSTSLPSIISLYNGTEYSYDPAMLQQASTSISPSSSTASNRKFDDYPGPLTDLSVLIEAQPSYANYESYIDDYRSSVKSSPCAFDTSIEHGTSIESDLSTAHGQFVSDDDLVRSLVAYADSFELDTSVYSIQNTTQMSPTSSSTLQMPSRRRSQSTTTHLTSTIENASLQRPKSCDDLSMVCSVTSSSKPTTVIPKDETTFKENGTNFIRSESHPEFFFASKTSHNDQNGIFQEDPQRKPVEEGTTTTGGSKIEWGFSSDTMAELNKPPVDLFNNYEASMDIGDINAHYLQDLERISSMAASMDFSQEMSGSKRPPPPRIVRKQSKDFVVKQQIDIQLLRPPTPPPSAPIIIREIRHKAPAPVQPIRTHQKLENTGQIRLSKTPSPIVFRERPPTRPAQEFFSQPTIIYRQLPTPPPITPSPPTVFVERLRSSASAIIQKPAPILIEKWLPYPPEQQRQIIYERASPLPIRSRRHTDNKAKKVIVEYDNVNVIVDKNVQQRKDIKRVNPEHYVHQYGNSLHSNEDLNELLNNVTCASQVRVRRTSLAIELLTSLLGQKRISFISQSRLVTDTTLSQLSIDVSSILSRSRLGQRAKVESHVSAASSRHTYFIELSSGKLLSSNTRSFVRTRMRLGENSSSTSSFRNSRLIFFADSIGLAREERRK